MDYLRICMEKHLSQRWLSLVRKTAGLLAVCTLAACATPQAPVAKAVYDLGLPKAAQERSPVLTLGAPTLAAPSVMPPVVVLSDIATGAALDSTAMVYRLAYADEQQLRPYTLARWSMPPAQLLRQRLRDALAERGPVLSPNEGNAAWRVVVELDEFSQVFDEPTSSAAVVQLRATLLRGDQSVAQQAFNARASAPSADAAGGARAMATAADNAARQLTAWVALHLAKP
jgi:cholesterol transport system auxiliary component